MRRRDLMIRILNEMKMLDEQVPPSRPVTKQHLDLVRSGRIDLTSLGRRLGPLSPFSRMLEGTDLVDVLNHGTHFLICVIRKV